MLYRGKYLIGFYEDDEYELPIAIFENIYEVAKYLNMSIINARQKMDLFFTGNAERIYINGKPYKVEFVEDEEKMNNKLYKGKYLIGVYEDKEDDDSLVVLLDNSRDFADYFDITIQNASTILKKAFDRKTNFFKYQGRKLKICFIEDEDDEDEDNE